MTPALLILGTLLAADPAPRVLNRVAAVVNGDVVTLHEVEQRAGAAYERARAMPPGEARDKARADALRVALDNLISERLFDGQAAALGVDVTAGEVDAAVEEIKRRNGIDDERLDEALAQQGMTRASFRGSVKRDIEAMRILQVKVRNRVKVTDEDVKAYWQSHPQEFQAGEEVHVRHLLLAVPATAAPEIDAQVKARAQKLAARARAGEDFAALARAESEGPSAKDGGDLGWLRRGTIQADLERAAFALPAGGVSDPVRTRAGWQVLKVEGRRGGGLQPFDEVKEDIRNRLVNEQVESYRSQYVAELRKDASIEIRVPELQPAAGPEKTAPAPRS